MAQLRKMVYGDHGITANFILYNEPDIVKVIKLGWLRWLAQLFRMQDQNPRSRNSVVGIGDWLWVGRPRGRSSSPSRIKNFLFSTSSRPLLGPTQPPIQWVPCALSPGVKRQGCEAEHSPPPSVEIKKMWLHTYTPTYAFMA
jgi:hypothetical protein